MDYSQKALELHKANHGKLEILGKLPALERPTISPLSDPEWVALNTIVSEHVVRELIPDLKHLGASGIVEYPLNKIVE